MILERSSLGRLVYVHVPKGVGGGVSDHFLVKAKEERRKIGFRRRKKQVQCREVIKVSELTERVKEQ